MKFFSLSYKFFWSCFFLIGIIAGMIAAGPIQLVIMKKTNSVQSSLSSITKPGSILPVITGQDVGSGYFADDQVLTRTRQQDSSSVGRWTTHNFNNGKLSFNDHLQQLQQHATAISDGQTIIDANEEFDPNNPVNPLDSLAPNYEVIVKWPSVTGEGTIAYIQEYFENEEDYSIDSDGFIKQSERDEWVVFEVINENNVEKIKIQLWKKIAGYWGPYNEEISETLREFFIDSENRPDIIYYIKKILDPDGYRDNENGYHFSSAAGFNALKNSLSNLADYAVVTTSAGGGTSEDNPEIFHHNWNLSCSSTVVCINYGSGSDNRKFASLEAVHNGKNAILKVIFRDIKWIKYRRKYYWEPANWSATTDYFPVTTNTEIIELQNRIQKQLNPAHDWTEPTAPDLSIHEDSMPDNFIKLQNYYDTSSSFVWSWELTDSGDDKEMKINNSRNSLASIYVNYDDNDINIRHTLAGIDGDQFQIPLADFEASDSELIKLINLINERLIYNFVSLIAELEDDDELAIKKIDLSTIYNFLEHLFNFDDSIDGKYTIGPINLEGYANPKFEIDFLPVPLPVGESAPQIFDLLKILSSQIATIPLDVWDGYFSFKESDTADTIKNELLVSLMQMLSLTAENGDVVNEFAYTGTQNDGDCDGTSCEIVNLTFQNQFHASELMTLLSSFYKYLILYIGDAVSISDNPITIAENLFVSENFLEIRKALQNLLADFFYFFTGQSNVFTSVLNSLFSRLERSIATIAKGNLNEFVADTLRKIRIHDETIDSLLYYLKLLPIFSQRFYAIFSDDFSGSQKKKLIDFLNLIIAPDGSPLIPVAFLVIISDFAGAFFQWSDVPSNVNTKESYSSELLQHLSLIVSAIGDEVFDYIEGNSLLEEFSFSDPWNVKNELRIEPYIKFAAAEERGIVFFKWYDVRNNIYYTTGIRRAAPTESKFEIIYHKNNQSDLLVKFLNALSDAQNTIDSQA